MTLNMCHLLIALTTGLTQQVWARSTYPFLT